MISIFNMIALLCIMFLIQTFSTLNNVAHAQSREPSAPIMGDLLLKAKITGKVRVIIGLDMVFRPEGELDGSLAVKKQQGAISRAQAIVLQELSAFNVSVARNFEYIPYMVLEVDQSALEALLASPLINTIEEDKTLLPTLTESIPFIGADDAWAMGYSGAGQTVAILDTGVDKTHSFLSGKVVSEACFSTTNSISSTLCPNDFDEQIGDGAGVNCSDSIAGCDHGTHVAGIATGSETDIWGVAKDANLLPIQVFSRFDSPSDCPPGSAPCIMSWSSDQIAAMERVFALRIDFNIAAVNMSLGGGRYYDTASCDADNASVKAAIDNLRSVGIATIVSSGNDGFTDSLSSPACISSSISVGATPTSYTVASYSNSASFLDLLAPGSSINSSVPGGSYETWNGTSMAAPHVTGAWAVLKSKWPDGTVDQVLTALTSTGYPIEDSRNGITKPLIQVDAALTEPEIDVQRPAGTSILNGGSDELGDQPVGTVNLTYTLDNTAGTAQLDVTGVTASSQRGLQLRSISLLI
jgi:subtilisin family serine protease